MTYRMRRRRMAEVTFIGRILAASTMLPESQYRFLTEMLAMEIFQENYEAQTIDFKHNLIKELHSTRKKEQDDNERRVRMLEKLEVTPQNSHPATEAEVEEAKRRLRRIQLKRASALSKEKTPSKL